MHLTISVNTVHLQMTVRRGIAIPQLVDIVAVAFTGSLTEVQWRDVHIGITQQRVAHHKDIVQLAVSSRNQTTAESLLTFVSRLYGRHRGRTDLHPHELPVEVEVIAQKLARLEGGILDATLGTDI